MENRFIIGTGTGRCGTHSFAYLLRQQNIISTHERFLLSWDFNNIEIDKMISILNNRNKSISADTAYYYINYVDYILKYNPNTKFVCIKRNKKKVVDSFYSKSKIKKADHWRSILPSYRNRYNCSKCFPKYETKILKKALSLYYDDFFNIAYNMENKYPDNFKIFNTDDLLNNRKTQQSMFEFVNLKNYTIILNIRKSVLKELT